MRIALPPVIECGAVSHGNVTWIEGDTTDYFATIVGMISTSFGLILLRVSCYMPHVIKWFRFVGFCSRMHTTQERGAIFQ